MDWKTLFDDSYENFEQAPSLRDNLKSVESSERYDSKELLNEGAMKKIYKCKDLFTGREVAYASPKSNELAHTESFLREANIAASLQHPNIIPIYDIGLNDEEPYFTMKMIRGQSLDQIIFKSTDQPPLASLISHFIKICEAISFAHSRGVLHLDLKPQNIQISEYGEVLICDWGLAKVTDWSQAQEDNYLNEEAFYKADNLQTTLFGYIKGTPGYLSPEQAKGTAVKKTYSSDIYSLGAILYSILTKKVTVEGKDLEEMLNKTRRGEIVVPREIDRSIPRALEAICLKALQVEEGERYSSVAEIIQDIERYIAGYAPMVEKVNLLQQILLVVRRKPILFVMAFTSITLIAVISSSASYQLQSKNNILALQKSEIEEQKNEINKHLQTVEKSKNELEKIAVLASKEAYNESWKLWLNFRIVEAVQFANTANRLNPNNIDFTELNHVVAFGEMKQEKARHLYEQLDPKNKEKYKFLKDYFIGIENRPEHFFRRLNKLHSKGFWYLSVALTYYYNLHKPHSEAKMAIMPKLIEMHFKTKVKNFEWSYSDGKYEINLSRNKAFKALHGITGLNVTKLDVSYSNWTQFEVVYLPNLELLDLSHSKLDTSFSHSLNQFHFPEVKNCHSRLFEFRRSNFTWFGRY